MVAKNMPNDQQSQAASGPPGFCKLGPEGAVTLQPVGGGILRVVQGRVWATLDGPHQGPANDWGDVVLCSGEQLRVAPGRHVVVESFEDAANEPVYFSWEPAPAAARQVPVAESGWRDALARPAFGAGDELGILLRALGRCLARLPGWLEYLVAGRGRVLSPLESNQP